MIGEKKQFCIECRRETGYRIHKTMCKHTIRGKVFDFEVLEARCDVCGEEVNLPGLMDRNAKLIDQQYRVYENLISIEEIQSLMKVYKLGKAPLSLALGFGEITITRYLMGQYPSAEYSGVMRRALSEPDYMIELLDENVDKVGNTAYRKAYHAAEGLKQLVDSMSEKMLLTISYIFQKAEDITPLALQKLLYYVQALFMVNYGRPMFEEECEAWLHGPVYAQVYGIFKSFKYNPIEDERFIIFKDKAQSLTEEERSVIDTVLNTFGVYSGKTLEVLTHKESPWSDVYDYNHLSGYANNVISKESIRLYFEHISRDYDLSTETGVQRYIRQQLAG